MANLSSVSQKSHAQKALKEKKKDIAKPEGPGTPVRQAKTKATETIPAAPGRQEKKTMYPVVTDFAEHFKQLGVVYQLTDSIIGGQKIDR